MPFLLTTYGLLLVFALFAIAQWKNAESFLITDLLAQARFSQYSDDAAYDISEKAKNLYRKDPAYKPKESQEKEHQEEGDEETGHSKPDSLEDTEEEKKQNGKRSTMLNISPLFREGSTILDGPGKSCFTLFKSLIQVLYEGEAFFDSLKTDLPDLEERFILACMESAKKKREETGKPLHTSSQLLKLDLSEDVRLEEARFGMMRGKKRRKKVTLPVSQVDHYMLQEFITINSNQKIMSVWLAPHPLLMAAFGDEAVVDEIIAARAEMYQELERERRRGLEAQQKTTLFDLKRGELQRRFKDLLISGVSHDHIDFDVSLTKPSNPK